ncbi:MAG: hypothetical protein COY46_01745, partial [Chloroflexi bacterium CG_4_10_14_0_8_um_filter_46_9]
RDEDKAYDGEKRRLSYIPAEEPNQCCTAIDSKKSGTGYQSVDTVLLQSPYSAPQFEQKIDNPLRLCSQEVEYAEHEDEYPYTCRDYGEEDI